MTSDISQEDLEPTERLYPYRVRKTVTCVICRAIYAPSHLYEYLAQAPAIALESALMSISHFCFRCRRPACPQCWDEVHGVCGACAQDAHLPFRATSAPLRGALFVSMSQMKVQGEAEVLPLICVRHGRFRRSADSLARVTASSNRPRHPSLEANSVLGPSHKVEALPRRPRLTRELVPESSQDVAEMDTQPARREDIIELDTQPVAHRSAWRSIERALTLCFALALLLILVMILLALFFPGANTVIAATLHIDIQAEIAYLLQLITHLH